MAVTVTDNRTILYQDGLTNITGASTSATDFFAESTGSAAEAYNIATGQIYWSGTTPNFTTTGNEIIYVWSAVVATQNGYKEAVASDSSHALYLSDGANDLLIYQAGNDRDVFKHADTQVSFQCFVIDIDYLSTANTNGDLAVTAGTFASFNSASTSMDVGAHYTTLSKALGGGQNCYLDIIRYGGADDGLQIAGGTTGDRGTYAEVAALDRSTADGRAHGIIREYTGGAYGVQGTLRHGDTGTATTYFEESGFTMTFEDRLVADDKYKLVVEANSTGTNVYNISGATISSARPGVTVDMSSSNINELAINQCTFSDLLNSISFPTDTNGTTLAHEVTNTTFSNCGQIDPGGVVFSGNTISNSADTTQGAVLLDSDGTSNWSDLSFISGGTGHAIYITATGTYNFEGLRYSGYASTDGSTGNEVIYNNSGGAVTINVSGGDTPTVRNGAGASTTVNNNITITLTALQNNTEVRVYEDNGSGVAGADIAGTENVTGNQFAFQTSASNDIIITIFDEDHVPIRLLYTTPTTSTSIPVSILDDRWYLNPAGTPGGASTYYFDGSVSSSSTLVTNLSNALDGSTSTFAEFTDQFGGSQLQVNGTTAPSSGSSINKVDARIYSSNPSGYQVDAFFYESSIGFPNTVLATINHDSTSAGWSSYEELIEPSGGWDWSTLQGLGVQVYGSSNGVTNADLYAIEIRVWT